MMLNFGKILNLADHLEILYVQMEYSGITNLKLVAQTGINANGVWFISDR